MVNNPCASASVPRERPFACLARHSITLIVGLAVFSSSRSVQCLNLNVAVIDFSSQFFDKISDQDKNQVISPLAMHSSLSMLASGLNRKSDASKALGKLLGYEDVSDDLHPAQKQYAKLLKKYNRMDFSHNKKLKMELRNRIIVGVDAEVDSKFKKDVTKYFDVECLTFAKRDRNAIRSFANDINYMAKDYGFSWAMLDEDKLVRSDSGISFLSTVFFVSSWDEIKYHKSDQAQFYNHGKKRVFVERALRSEQNVRIKMLEFSEDLAENCFKCEKTTKPNDNIPDFRMIQLKLRGDFTFTIIEPIERSGSALKKLEQELLKCPSEAGYLAKVLKDLDETDEINIDWVMLPAFRIETHTDVKTTLVNSFNLGSLTKGGPITDILENKELNLGFCDSNAVIQVDPKGVMGAAHGHQENPYRDNRIKIQYPFMFVLRHYSMPIYLGHVVKVNGQD